MNALTIPANIAATVAVQVDDAKAMNKKRLAALSAFNAEMSALEVLAQDMAKRREKAIAKGKAFVALFASKEDALAFYKSQLPADMASNTKSKRVSRFKNQLETGTTQSEADMRAKAKAAGNAKRAPQMSGSTARGVAGGPLPSAIVQANADADESTELPVGRDASALRDAAWKDVQSALFAASKMGSITPDVPAFAFAVALANWSCSTLKPEKCVGRELETELANLRSKFGR